uniref:putative reverse transcriptase/maturase n=1 Tax=Porphyridium aerugineum TaxID=2792 RepID=UPI001FCD6847|nr:putative reverse transcriptase/maturase [Porphyridium aerugineum]UNJ17893.1 putative reverse transcriptase/maturase [Porphyridium aerugineum]
MGNDKELFIQNWNIINWKQVTQVVFNTQQRIWQAAAEGNIKVLRALQKKAFNSWSFKLLAVKQVTNKKFIQNIAGIKYKTYIPNEYRMELIKALSIQGYSLNLMQIDINQNNLGQIIQDSALQMLIRMIIEPEWDARLEDNTYGYKSGYNIHDLISYIAYTSKKSEGYNYIIHGHIAKKKDSINYEYIIKKSKYSGLIAKQLNLWLESNCLEVDGFFTSTLPKTNKYIISPIIVNILLHGLEWAIEEQFNIHSRCSLVTKNIEFSAPIKVIRFFDYLIIMMKKINNANEVVDTINLFLEQANLEINKDSSEVTHIEKGFDFLGFKIQRILHDEQISIVPSFSSMKNHYINMRNVLYHSENGKIRATTNKSLDEVIKELNPIITKWSLYYKDFIPSEIFHSLDWKISNIIYKWFKKKVKATNTLSKWRKNCQIILNGKQRIGTDFNSVLIIHSSFKHNVYKMPPYGKSFYDGDNNYWSIKNSVMPIVEIQ